MGEFSEGVDTWRDESVSRPPVGYLPYGDRKPYVLADRLTALNGPTRGVITLPRHLDWSGHAEYDLSRPVRLAGMYKVVLTEAATVEDLRMWLSGDLLLRLWPTLWLPPQLRRRWEERFPELATRTNAAGLLERLSEDVDLFTGWNRRDEFGTAVTAVVQAYRDDLWRSTADGGMTCSLSGDSRQPHVQSGARRGLAAQRAHSHGRGSGAASR